MSSRRRAHNDHAGRLATSATAAPCPSARATTGRPSTRSSTATRTHLWGWLRGCEALSAVWLAATELDLTLLPLSAAIEVPGTLQTLRHMLADLGEPYLVVRLGVGDPDHAGPPHTPACPPIRSSQSSTTPVPTDQLVAAQVVVGGRVEIDQALLAQLHHGDRRERPGSPSVAVIVCSLRASPVRAPARRPGRASAAAGHPMRR